MSAIVPETCPIVSAAGTANAEPVRGVSWQDLGSAANHLLGRGGMLIPTTWVGDSIADGATGAYPLRLWPRYQATHRVWTISMVPSGADVPNVTFTDPSGGTSGAWRVADRVPPRAFRHVETISSRTSSEVTTAVSIEPAGADVTVLSIGCYEVARPELALDSSDLGVDLDTLGGGRPMYAQTGRSVGGVIFGAEGALATAKRNGLLYILRDLSAGFSFTTTSYVNPLAGTLTLTDRKKYRSETARAVAVRAFGITGATTTLDLRVSTAGAGDSLVLSWAAGDTGSWKTGTLEANVEDLDDARGGPGDVVTIEGKRTTGSNAARITSVIFLGD